MMCKLKNSDNMTIFYVIWVAFSYLVALHWSIISTFVLIGFIGSLFYKNDVPKEETKAKNVELVIVSKASSSVHGVLFNCIDYHAKKYHDYKIDVVIDKGSELENKLDLYIKQYPNVSLRIVPDSFKAKAIAKGRAIHHHILNRVHQDKWYVFIDDDNMIMDDRFLYEIKYYDKKGYVAANGILKPRYSGNPITYVADFLRYVDDLTLFRFLTGVIGRPLNGFHGELMIIKGSVLRKIGFDRMTVTEDFAFARELDKYEHKVWQSSTLTTILSPHTISDFIKQRNRWHRGISKDVQDGTIAMKLIAGVRAVDLFVAIVGSWVIFPIWFFMPIPLWWAAFNIIGAGYYIITYIYGSTRLIGKTRYWFLYMFLIPLYSVMETVVPHYRPKDNGFNVIHKDNGWRGTHHNEMQNT